jgi:hypothetical protein
MSVLKSKKEIEDQMYKAQSWTSEGNTDVKGMSYEEGVEAALRWVLGEESEEPVENEYVGE